MKNGEQDERNNPIEGTKPKEAADLQRPQNFPSLKV